MPPASRPASRAASQGGGGDDGCDDVHVDLTPPAEPVPIPSADALSGWHGVSRAGNMWSARLQVNGQELKFGSVSAAAVGENMSDPRVRAPCFPPRTTFIIL